MLSHQGMPSTINTQEELAEALTIFIFIGSVGHAAANFCQYDEYAFPLNYPAKLIGERPKDKVMHIISISFIIYFSPLGTSISR